MWHDSWLKVRSLNTPVVIQLKIRIVLYSNHQTVGYFADDYIWGCMFQGWRWTFARFVGEFDSLQLHTPRRVGLHLYEGDTAQNKLNSGCDRGFSMCQNIVSTGPLLISLIPVGLIYKNESLVTR